MEAIPSDILEIFRKALSESRDHESLALASIASSLDVSKKYLERHAAEYETLRDIMDRIDTNIEANVIRASSMGVLDRGWTKFALSSNHGWKEDSTPQSTQKIIIEGMDSEGVRALLNGE